MFDSIFIIAIVTSGGYILAVVQFFREYKTVQKLELEIAVLREAAKRNGSSIRIPTLDEIERFGRLKSWQPPLPDNKTVTLIVVGVCAIFMAGGLVQEKRASEELALELKMARNMSAELGRELSEIQASLLGMQASSHGEDDYLTVSILKRELERVGAAPFDWDEWLTFKKMLPQPERNVPRDWRPPMLLPEDRYPVVNNGERSDEKSG